MEQVSKQVEDRRLAIVRQYYPTKSGLFIDRNLGWEEGTADALAEKYGVHHRDIIQRRDRIIGMTKTSKGIRELESLVELKSEAEKRAWPDVIGYSAKVFQDFAEARRLKYAEDYITSRHMALCLRFMEKFMRKKLMQKQAKKLNAQQKIVIKPEEDDMTGMIGF